MTAPSPNWMFYRSTEIFFSNFIASLCCRYVV